MLSSARFQRSLRVKYPNDGALSAETCGQGTTACLTLGDSPQAMAKQQQQPFLEANKVTWLTLYGMGLMAVIFITFCVSSFFPLKEKVAVIENTVNRIDNTVQGINANLKQAKADAQHKDEELRASITEDTLPSLLKNTTEGNPEELKKSLPRAQHYIAIAKEKKLPVDTKTIKDRGVRLLNARKECKDYDCNQQAWQTVSKLASLKTVASANSRPLSQAIEESKAKGILFEGGQCTLGFDTREGSVFKDCTVIYKGGRVDLEKVYFINCDFDVEQSDAGEQFLMAIFNSNGALINFDYPRKKHLGIPGRDGSS
jgi:hypothetical protein